MRVEAHMVGIEGLDTRTTGPRIEVWGSGFVQGSGFRVCSGFGVQGSRFRIWGKDFFQGLGLRFQA